jgi:homoserine dehydrogenase
VIPIFAILHEGLAASEIVKIEGILNGTTNYILTRMSEGTPYAQAIESAKKAGFCETNPSDDLSGLDAARKLVIIANVLMDYNLPLSAVKTRGIEDITQAKILESHLQNQVIKHIASLELTDNGILASVEPKSINISNPLAHVNGIMNAINLTTKEAGEVTLSGVGAGPREVSAVILSDIIAIGMKFK